MAVDSLLPVLQGHQQSRYWICNIRDFFILRGDMFQLRVPYEYYKQIEIIDR